jgi:hypothetical protein
LLPPVAGFRLDQSLAACPKQSRSLKISPIAGFSSSSFKIATQTPARERRGAPPAGRVGRASYFNGLGAQAVWLGTFWVKADWVYFVRVPSRGGFCSRFRAKGTYSVGGTGGRSGAAIGLLIAVEPQIGIFSQLSNLIFGLGNRCSVRLSYGTTLKSLDNFWHSEFWALFWLSLGEEK